MHPRPLRWRMLPILVLALSVWLAPWAALADGPLLWEHVPGPCGGPVKALALNSQEPELLYIGTLSGLYRSRDGGQTWQRLSGEQLACPEINAIVLDPGDPNWIYVGTDQGLFRSTDGGNSWLLLKGLRPGPVLGLVAHPALPGVFYAALEHGVQRSANWGNTWVQADAGLPGAAVRSLAVNFFEPHTVYAATDAGLYVTRDDGASWQPLAGFGTQQAIEAIALGRAQPLIYAGTNQGLSFSQDGGETWSLLGQGLLPSPVTLVVLDPVNNHNLYAVVERRQIYRSLDGGEHWAALGSVNEDGLVLALELDPRDPQRLYAGGGKGFYRSLDGGKTWAPSNQGIHAAEVRRLLDIPRTQGTFYAATRWGLYRTQDGCATWEPALAGPSTLNLLALAMDPGDARQLYAGTWEGEILHSADGGTTWERLHGPLERDAQITGLEVCRFPEGSQERLILYATTAEPGGIWRSLDLGRHWESLAEGLPARPVGAMRISRGPAPQLYVGVAQMVYRQPVRILPAGPAAWEQLTPEPLNGNVTCLLMDVSGEGLYAATDLGGIYYRPAEEPVWREVNRGISPAGAIITALALVPLEGRGVLLCAAADGEVFYSRDGGRRWTSGGKICGAQAVITDMTADDETPGVLYLATARSGIYRGRLRPAPLAPILGYGAGVVALAGFAFGGRYLWRRRRKRLLLQQRMLLEQNWELWNQEIVEALVAHQQVTPAMLPSIPAPLRLLAMVRYVDTHRDQDLRFYEEAGILQPAKQLPLKRFANNWASLQERLGNVERATPIAAQLVEQLCGLLGFSPLESRGFRSLLGYVVKAPAVRLSIPPRFPIIFLLKEHVDEEDVSDARDLMRVLNATSFFALLIVVDESPQSREKAKELRRLVRGSADDLIVLDYRDLVSLFLANDAENRLIELILDQVDLNVVSPYITSGPVPENMFFGRDYELKAIMRTIRDRSFAIVGGRKIGKTSVLTKVNRLMEQTGGLQPFYLDCQYVNSYDEFFRAVALTCQVQVESAAPDMLRRIILRVRRQHEGQMLVLLLDEVDGLLLFDLANQMRLFRVLRALSQEGLCRFVFCGERQLHASLHDPDSPLFNFCNAIRLSYLAPRDALRMIQEPMAAMGITFEPAEVPQDIVELSSCHPNLVQAICKLLIARINARSDRVITAEDLKQVRASDEFREFYFEVTWGNATPLERLITLVMAGVPDFGPAEVKQALETRGCTASPAEIAAALEGLVLFSILRKQGQRYVFAARSFGAILAESNMGEMFIENLLERLAAGAGEGSAVARFGAS